MIARRVKLIYGQQVFLLLRMLCCWWFCAVRLGALAEPVSTSLGAVSLQTVKKTIQAPLVTPKPEMKSQIPSPPQPQPTVVPDKKPEVIQPSPQPQAAQNLCRLFLKLKQSRNRWMQNFLDRMQ